MIQIYMTLTIVSSKIVFFICDLDKQTQCFNH